jgi:hypothetical protein
MIKSIICAMSLFSAVSSAKVEKTSIQSQTRATGQEKVIQFSVSPCTTPNPWIVFTEVSSMTVESNFTYKTCREYVTYDYEVTGSLWNRDWRELTETRRLAYRLEDQSRGSSRFLIARNGEKSVDAIEYLTASQLVVAECTNKRFVTNNTTYSINQTSCQ